MKKLLALTLLGVVMTTATAQARDTDEVRLAIDVPYEPFVYRTPAGELEGFEIDLGNELCKRANLDCTWVEQSWDGIIPGLLSRKYDAILSSMAITPERENQVLFSIPYYNTPSVWITRRDRDIDINDKDALEGLSVGVQRGTIRDSYVTQMYGDTLDIRRYSSSQDVANDLVSGRLDLSFEDYPLAVDTFHFKDDDSEFKKIGESIKKPVSIFGKGAAMAFRKRDRELAEKFNQAIRDVYADGTYEKLMKQYFDYDLSLPVGEK
ncbi:transporter substrate-binding domain-containing protein [Chromohalobacter canadensis]|uniref:Transporter substrate-binding domain-containing protein n=1 Tax=Chromohalobacter canadensis TaxID=141389 RepID=A0ABZ0YDG9_9GAMM|nr:transporter substrate-binding domain-containing protein [Chromohalobacter canadensis]MCK0767400.1 transporter substrate-binding domain-containing protein [Chromohalobacter canadensis]WQH09996.1 transporter substrate-binding domain-containing protein [Chromohalobacter canadensis]